MKKLLLVLTLFLSANLMASYSSKYASASDFEVYNPTGSEIVGPNGNSQEFYSKQLARNAKFREQNPGKTTSTVVDAPAIAVDAAGYNPSSQTISRQLKSDEFYAKQLDRNTAYRRAHPGRAICR